LYGEVVVVRVLPYHYISVALTDVDEFIVHVAVVVMFTERYLILPP